MLPYSFLRGRRKMKKILVVGIILLFIGSSIPTLAQTMDDTRPLSRTLYVGGSGPGNYSKIQSAIDNASNGDIIFVYPGCYNERITISKQLDIFGDNKNTTIIEGYGYFNLVYITANTVSFHGFTLTNAGAGIFLFCTDNCRIYNTVISKTQVGIDLESNHVSIFENIINNNSEGIRLWAPNAFISYNIIKNNSYGIRCDYSITGSNIFFNKIIGNGIGIDMDQVAGANIENNNISLNSLGIYSSSSDVNINDNNIYLNERNAKFKDSKGAPDYSIWNNNYWGKIVLPKKIIFGTHGIFHVTYYSPLFQIYLPAYRVDSDPRLTPIRI